MLRFSLVLLLALATCVLSGRIVRDAMPEAEAAAEAKAAPDASPQSTEKPAPEKKDAKQPAAQYTSKFDNINVDQILKSERLLNNYHKCLLDRGPCTPDAAELKRLLPDALETGCTKCTEKQRTGSEKVITYIIKNKPEQWEELLDKFDKERKFRERYQKLAEEKGFKV
ncbi:ejaculatory bulb-specific protein 3-like [Neocloeon triangulifer]|uniref:ejaculatory bulb-specific protein 3-like n=1 Tax=Neocloeon triangulifer TaxID=2078957 RepID=UPI00286F67E5|nr:ejaculatory bulb-specific protein 3-like [Neocloeon triangulifer]